MNRYIVIFVIFFISACKVFNHPKSFLREPVNQLNVHAIANLKTPTLSNIKLKANIKISKDSILVSGSPFLGISLFRLTITDEWIVFNTALQNKKDSILTQSLDRRFKLKAIQQYVFQKKKKNDTVAYNSPYMSAVFTNFIKQQNIFLPQTITFQTTLFSGNSQQGVHGHLDLDYQSVKLIAKKIK